MKKHLNLLIIILTVAVFLIWLYLDPVDITAQNNPALNQNLDTNDVADSSSKSIPKPNKTLFHRPIRTIPKPTFADVQYGPHEENTLDIYIAESNEPTPIMLFIGSGVSNSGNFGGRKNMSIDLFRKCLANGISVASVNYCSGYNIPIQERLQDFARAVQFVRYNTEKYNIDKNRLAVFGIASGGGASLWLGFCDDLADPDSSDPVLRESSKPSVVGSKNGPCSYDLLQWPQLVGPDPDPDKSIRKVHLFYGFNSREDLFSEEGEKIRADVDMLGLLTEDDPPVFLSSNRNNTEPTDEEHYFRHPRHNIVIKQKCDELGVDCGLISTYASNQLPLTKSDRNNMLLAFFMRYLKPEPVIAK